MNLAAAWTAFKSWMEAREHDRALSQFTCAHCTRSDQCGRGPSSDCIEKLQQVYADDSWRYRPAARLRNRAPYE